MRVHDALFRISCIGALCAFFSCLPRPDTDTEYVVLSSVGTEVGASSTSYTLKGKAVAAWQASSSESWCQIKPASGARGDLNMTLSIAQNESAEADRTAVVSVKSSSYTAKFTLRQLKGEPSLNIIQSTIQVSAAQTSRIVTGMANGSWSVAGDYSWCHVTPTSGLSGTITLNVDIDANPDTQNSRSATFSVTSGTITKSFSVTQAKADLNVTLDRTAVEVGATAGTETVTGSANGAWTLSGTSSWCRVTPVSGTAGVISLAVAYDANPDPQSTRTATFTVTNGTSSQPFTLTQAKAAPTVALDRTAVAVGAGQTTETVTGSANGAWSVSGSYNWCRVTPASGAAGTISLSVAVDANADSQNTRTATFTVTNGTSSQQFTVTQDKADPPQISVTDNDIQVTATQTTASVTGTANGPWTLTGTSTWCDPTPKLSLTPGAFSIALALTPNPTTSPRNSTFTLTNSTASTQFTVSQAGAAPTLTLTGNTINTDAAAATKSVTGASNGPWTVAGSYGWCRITPTGGEAGPVSLSVHIDANTDPSGPRTATFTVANGAVTQSVSVTQAAAATSVTINEANPITFPAEAQTFTLTGTSNGPWNLTGSSSWCRITPASGQAGSISLSVSVDANPDTQSGRNAEFTLHNGTATRTIQIVQREKTPDPFISVNPGVLNLGAAATQEAVVVTSNKTWTASGVPSWITLDYGTVSGSTNVTVKAEAHTNTAQGRSAVITFFWETTSATLTVNQAKADPPAPQVTLTNSNVQVTATQTSATVTGSANGTWSLSGTSTWCTPTPTSGAAGPISISLAIIPNETTSPRNSTFTVVNGTASESFTVTQAAATPTLSLSGNTISTAAAATTKAVSGMANGPWSVTGTSSWCRVTPAGGPAGPVSITVEIDANTDTANPRTATFTVANGTASQTISVTQAKADLPSVTLDNTDIQVGATQTSATVTGSANGAWSLTGTSAWCAPTPTSGAAGAISVALAISPNETTSSRSATFTIANGTASRQFTVTQAGATPTLTLADNTINTTPAATTKSVTGTSNGPWTVTGSSTWCRVSPASGAAGPVSITVTIDQNTDTANLRTASFTVANGTITKTISVTQAKADATADLTLTPETVTANPAGGMVRIEGWARTDYPYLSGANSWCYSNTSSVVRNGDNSYTFWYELTLRTNTTGSSRPATLTVTSGSATKQVTVNQAAYTGGGLPDELNFTPAQAQFPATASTVKLTGSSRDVWYCQGNEWCTASPSWGPAGPFEITLSAKANPSSSDSRNAQLSVNDAYGQTKYFYAVQAAAQSSLNLTQNELVLPALKPNPNSTGSITFVCNGPWSVSGSSNWCRIDPASGGTPTQAGYLTIKYDDNTDTQSERQAQFTMHCGTVSRTLTIRQLKNATQNYVYLSSNNLTISQPAYMETIYVTTGGPSILPSLPDWCYSGGVNSYSLNNAGTYAYSLYDRFSNSKAVTDRAYDATFTSGSASAVLHITHLWRVLRVDLDRLTVTSAGSAACKYDLMFSLAAPWTASSDSGWLTLPATSGTGERSNNYLTVNLAANGTGQPRKGTVTINCGGYVAKVEFTQLAQPMASVPGNSLSDGFELAGISPATATNLQVISLFSDTDLSFLNSSTQADYLDLSFCRQIDSSQEAVPQGMFTNAARPKTIVLPAHIKTIGIRAFKGSAVKTINLPASLTEIKQEAFSESQLTGVLAIPTGCTVQEYAFYNCTGITGLTLGSSGPAEIPGNAFSNIPNVKGDLVIPEGVKDIGPNAFKNTGFNGKLVLPSTITRIQYGAFPSTITSIVCRMENPAVVTYGESFGGVNKSIPVYVPAHLVNTYKSTSPWKSFTNIQAIP